MPETPRILSQCPACAGVNAPPVEDYVDTEDATCIQCHRSFCVPAGCAVASVDTTPIAALRLGAVFNRLCRTWKAAGLASFGSVVTNGGLLALLGLIWFSQQVSVPSHVLQGTFSALDPDVPRFETVVVLETGSADDGSSTSGDFSVSPMLSQNVVMSPSGDVALPFGNMGDSGESTTRGTGSGHGLFSGGENAGSFAYVVDASGSMDGARMRLVLLELSRSVSTLKDSQDFFVVFFSDKTFPMMWPKTEHRLIAANDANRSRILEWAFSVRPDGGTNPQGALQQALELKPDVVYFLTDGQVPDTTLRVVRRFRKNPTVVNTICVGSQAATEMMKKIAVAGGGEFVSVR